MTSVGVSKDFGHGIENEKDFKDIGLCRFQNNVTEIVEKDINRHGLLAHKKDKR